MVLVRTLFLIYVAFIRDGAAKFMFCKNTEIIFRSLLKDQYYYVWYLYMFSTVAKGWTKQMIHEGVCVVVI